MYTYVSNLFYTLNYGPKYNSYKPKDNIKIQRRLSFVKSYKRNR